MGNMVRPLLVHLIFTARPPRNRPRVIVVDAMNGWLYLSRRGAGNN
jgi:hypothetical protein